MFVNHYLLCLEYQNSFKNNISVKNHINITYLIFSRSSYLQAKPILNSRQTVVRTDIAITPQHAKENHYNVNNGALLCFGYTTCLVILNY